MKILNNVMAVVMGAFGGAAIAEILFVCFDYSMNPQLYEMNSAPWYTDIVGRVLITLAFFAVFLGVYFILRKVIKHRKNKKNN